MRSAIYPIILASAALTAASALAQQSGSSVGQVSGNSATSPTRVVQPSSAPAAASGRGIALSTGRRPTHVAGRRTMVVPDGRTTAEQLTDLVADMTIMCRILETKAVLPFTSSRSGHILHIWSTGTQARLFSPSQNGPSQSLYVAGYGLVFFLGVDFPLAAPPQAEGQQTGDTPRDDLWTRTQREMYEPDGSTDMRVDQPVPSYDAEKVERFTASLVGALKHAANIRHVEATDWITVTVQSPRLEANRIVASTRNDVDMVFAALSASAPPSRSTLSVRAKKPDIDAFARDELDLEQFRQRAEIVTY